MTTEINFRSGGEPAQRTHPVVAFWLHESRLRQVELSRYMLHPVIVSWLLKENNGCRVPAEGVPGERVYDEASIHSRTVAPGGER